jgi:DNA-binding transcriptional LysR family regulator
MSITYLRLLLYSFCMDVRRLTYFLVVAREGSFSRAAVRLHMTQPPLSLAIAELEKELGVDLLRRSPRGVTPTEAGLYLIASGEKVLSHLDEIKQDLGAMGQGGKGKVSIASVPTVTWTVLPDVLQRFLRIAPEVDVFVSDPPPAQAIDSVLQRQVDLGVIATVSVDQLRETYRRALHVLEAGHLPMVAGLPPGMATASATVHLADLHREVWLLPARSLRFKGLLDAFYALWDQLGLPPPTVRPVGTLQTAIPLVVAGLGVTMLPDRLRAVAYPGLVVRPFADAVPSLTAAVIWSRDHEPSPAMTRLLDEFSRG